MSAEPIRPTGVKLDPSIKARLEKLGNKKRRSTHWLMKEAILEYVEREEERERLKQETMKRWEEVNEGKVASNQDVMDWLDTWGKENEKGRPACKKKK